MKLKPRLASVWHINSLSNGSKEVGRYRQSPQTLEEEDAMRKILYPSAVGSLMYAMLCTRPDICYAVGVVSRYQSNPGPEHWIAVKHILKYLRRTRDYMLVYKGGVLNPVGYTDSDFSD